MIEKIKKSLSEVTENIAEQAIVITDVIMDKASNIGGTIKEQATHLGDAAKEKSNAVIQAWVNNLPQIESYGLKTIYFSATMSLNPSLELEMKGSRMDFSMERLDEILKEIKNNTILTLIFTAIKNTLKLYESAGIEVQQEMYIKIGVKLSPEIKVAFGNPIVY